MFRSATFRLTLWYLAIIMAISILFSWVIYNTSLHELSAGLRRQAVTYHILPRYDFTPPVPERESLDNQVGLAEQRLRLNLLILNLAILTLAGGASYFLAQWTLQPIEDALDAQSRFTADASHELRTPLTAMKTEIEVALRNKQLDVKESKELLASNLEEISKLEALSNGLLKLAQHDQHNTPKESVQIKPVVAAAVDRLDTMMKQREVKLEQKLTEFTAHGDSESLVELVVVLLDNAVKYSPKKAKIQITSRTSGHYGYLAITDHGEGIKASDIPHIFDRFYRADNSRTKNQTDGYGLGLSIAQKIAEAHNGAIDVKSTPGKGSTFTIKLRFASA
jgi:signal transduction histidine kinase